MNFQVGISCIEYQEQLAKERGKNGLKIGRKWSKSNKKWSQNVQKW
jgi:hypothetical protein